MSKLKKRLEREHFLNKMAFPKIVDMGRLLTQEEITQLESQQNITEDWSKIRVHDDFSPKSIYRVIFKNFVYLGKFQGEVTSDNGEAYNCGIVDSVISNSIIENAVVFKVNYMDNIFVSEGSLLLSVESIIWNEKRDDFHFPIRVGDQMGSRSCYAFPTINWEDVENFSSLKPNEQKELEGVFNEISVKSEKVMGYVGKNCIIRNTPVISNTWCSDSVFICNAKEVRSSFLASGSVDKQTKIGTGSLVSHSILQGGSKVDGFAQVYRSVLCPYCFIDKNATVTSSIIGWDAIIHRGEITSSILGSLVILVHHALVISTLWYQGYGNVAHGASIGSNHTGRKPDQEAFVGRSIFFGLGVQVKFPVNLSSAPFSLISQGTKLLPQKIECPFSLVVPCDNNVRQNRIIPGWVWWENLYSLFRNDEKYKVRSHQKLPYIFCFKAVRLIVHLLPILEGVETKEDYNKKDIPELGDNILLERDRFLAIKSYRSYLYVYLVNEVMEQNTQLDLYQEIVTYLSKNSETNVLSYLKENIYLLTELFQRLDWSIQKDYDRGKQYMQDYEVFHAEDELLTKMKQKITAWESYISNLNS